MEEEIAFKIEIVSLEIHAWGSTCGSHISQEEDCNAICLRCYKTHETTTHLLSCCLELKKLLTHIQKLAAKISVLLVYKQFWIFGRFRDSLASYFVFLHWIKYWALWTLWMQ